MDKRLQDAPCGVITMDTNGVIQEVNDRFSLWMIFDEKELVGKNLDVFLSRANKMFFHTYFYPTIHIEEFIEEFFTYFINKKGDSIPFLLNANKQIRDGKTVIEIMLIQMKTRINYEMELRKIQKDMKTAYYEQEDAYEELIQLHQEIQQKQEELMEVNQALVKLSNTDKLTLLPNRRYFETELTRQRNLSLQYKKPLSIAMIDIDFFKKVNDTYGHLTGDKVLSHLATLLKQYSPENATLARYGGEEFVCILPNHHREEAIKIASLFNEKVANHPWETVNHLTISLGIATMQEDDTEESLLERADRALYHSKENGRNQVTYFST